MSNKKSVASVIPAVNLQSAIHIGAELFIVGTMFFYFKKEISALKIENMRLKETIAEIIKEMHTTNTFPPPQPPKPNITPQDNDNDVENEIHEIEQSRNSIKNDEDNDNPPNPFLE